MDPHCFGNYGSMNYEFAKISNSNVDQVRSGLGFGSAGSRSGSGSGKKIQNRPGSQHCSTFKRKAYPCRWLQARRTPWSPSGKAPEPAVWDQDSPEPTQSCLWKYRFWYPTIPLREKCNVVYSMRIRIQLFSFNADSYKTLPSLKVKFLLQKCT